MKFKPLILLTVLLLVLSACNAPSESSAPLSDSSPITSSVEDTPAPFPDTPSPPEIDAPLVESPALITIQFINELNGWGVTETQIVRTNDGGITWYNVTPPGITEAGYSVQMFILDNNNIWAHLPDFENYPNGGTLYHTTNGGLGWQSGAIPFSGGDIQFIDANNGWALADLGVGAGSNAVAIYQTIDGGATWTQKFTNDPNLPNASDSLPLGGLKGGIAPVNMQTAWVYGVVYSSGTIYLHRTDNSGVTWTPVTSLPLSEGAENFELGIDPDNMQFISSTVGFMAVRMSGASTGIALYVTTDAGNTWSLTPTLIPEGGSADFLSENEAVVYNGQQFYVTRDAARTWSIIPPDVNFGETFAFMDFVNPDSGWVITIDPTTNHRSLYRTSDGGATWFPVIE